MSVAHTLTVEAASAPPPAAPVVTPLGVPWLRHDSFPTVKKVCAPEGLMQAKKATVVRVLQELKKGRSHIEQQLVQLETELLHVDDFLNGTAPKLELVHLYAQPPPEEGEAELANGDATASSIENGEGAMATNAVNPVAALVEEDLASETPCTTVGLWRYLSVYPFFKTVTLEDMQEALLLDEPLSAFSADMSDVTEGEPAVDVLAPVASLSMLDDPLHTVTLGADRVNELLRMRLVAAMIPDSSTQENDVKQASDDGDADTDMDVLVMKQQWDTSHVLHRLHDIGLVEDARVDTVSRALRRPHDDEVSGEIRALQEELAFHIRRNNEFKRTLRRSFERLKPWVTHDEEVQQIESKFLKMWNRKKEMRRKRKHKQKKQLRQDVSRKSAFTVAASVPVQDAV